MTRDQKYQTFRALHERPGTFLIPNPWNAGSAKILSALGFPALATTSAGYAFSSGREDSTAALTRDGVLANAQAIVAATDLPVSADLLDGFGPAPATCAETIRLAAALGLAGGSIEDATADPLHPIYDFNHAVERVAAAAQSAHDHHLLLTARAENFLHGIPDLDDTIRRLQAFALAGAGVLYAPGLHTLDAVRQVCASVSQPVNVLMNPAFTVAQLAAAGAKRISVGGTFARAALGALLRAAHEFQDLGTFTFTADTLPYAQATAFMANPKK